MKANIFIILFIFSLAIISCSGRVTSNIVKNDGIQTPNDFGPKDKLLVLLKNKPGTKKIFEKYYTGEYLFIKNEDEINAISSKEYRFILLDYNQREFYTNGGLAGESVFYVIKNRQTGETYQTATRTSAYGILLRVYLTRLNELREK
ncbi:hypothetical protein [Elizabethkingia meningoseptica]|uniref:hypothetical protein n=1 Tax=Elizabethkingia meningoseptica TaxID=238 RepID=UPI0038916E55